MNFSERINPSCKTTHSGSQHLKNPGKPEDHTPIQTRILKELNELKDKEKLNPQEGTESRNEFHKRFDWTDTLLTETEKQAIEDLLVEYHDIFARHRMGIGMNTEFKVKLTPKDDKAVYSQSLSMPIHLKEDLIVEMALMHNHGIITILSFSKYASPIFAQRKPNGKLRLLVDLRKINSLNADDYTNNNHPEHSARHSTTPGREITVLQARLLTSLSLFADGGPTVSGNACIQFYQQNTCPQKKCTRS